MICKKTFPFIRKFRRVARAVDVQKKVDEELKYLMVFVYETPDSENICGEFLFVFSFVQ